MWTFKRTIAAVLFCIIPTVAFADPISAILSVAFAAASTFGIPALGIAGGAIAGFGIVGSFLIRAGLGLALNALSASAVPSGRSASSGSLSSRGYTVTQSGSALDHQIIYGRVRTGGVRIYDESTGSSNKFLHRVIAFAAHECESIDEVLLDGEVLTLDGNGDVTAPSRYVGLVTVKKHLGATNQLADTDLVASSAHWTSAHRLRGICYIYIKFKFDAEKYPNGVPSVTATVKGKKLYDPRSGLTEWSDNPALCIRDYIASPYGLNTPNSGIDDTLVSTAANVCDETSTLAGTTRYTCNGAFTTAITPKELLASLGTAMGGVVWYAQGKWRMKAAKWTATVMDLDEDDLRSGLTVQTRHSRRDNYNTITGTFRGEESSWQTTDFPPVTNSAYVTADGGDEIAADLELNFTDNSVEARRIGLIALEQQRQQITVTGTFAFRTFELQVGDNIRLSNSRLSWSLKEFEVISWTFTITDQLELVTQMTLRETAESVYDEVDDGIVYERDNTTLPSPFDVPNVGLSASASLRLVNEKLSNVISVVVSSSQPSAVDEVELQYKKSADSDWISHGTGDLGKFDVVDLDAADYDFRARARNTFNIWAEDWEYLVDISSIVAAGAPSDVTGLSADLIGGAISLSWDASADGDLSYYIIRYAIEEVAATYKNATTVVEKVPRPGTNAIVPARPGTYFVRAINKQGYQSENAATIVVPETSMQDFANTLTQAEHTAFSGTKTGTTVVSSELRLSSYATAPASGEYEFSTYIDTGAVRTSRVRIDLAVERFDASAGLFDDLPGLFDSLAGLFDDLSGNSQAADSNIVRYIATTDDDPSGSPTWSAWQPFRAGDFNARAFKFKIELLSTTDDVTPSVTELTARVEYD